MRPFIGRPSTRAMLPSAYVPSLLNGLHHHCRRFPSYYTYHYLTRHYHIALDVAGHMIPHPSKKSTGGEDAFFISRNKRAFGVADGVGGWNEVGVNPALYSRGLMDAAKEAYHDNPELRSMDIMASASNAVMKVTGSATAVIATVTSPEPNEPVVIEVSNLGDSGIFHCRQGKILFRSTEQTWAFNAPFQLGTGSDYSAEDADQKELTCLPGDLVVLATDGFFDNIFNDTFAALLADYSGLRSAQLCKGLSELAFQASMDPRRSTPFAEGAVAHGYDYPGGKPDDITVVVARVYDRNAVEDDF